jgi:hypothetical protein
MDTTLHADMRVRCKTEPRLEGVQGRQFGLDRFLLARQPGRSGVEARAKGAMILCGRAECRQQLMDDRAAEPGFEQLLNLDDEGEVSS